MDKPQKAPLFWQKARKCSVTEVILDNELTQFQKYRENALLSDTGMIFGTNHKRHRPVGT